MLARTAIMKLSIRNVLDATVESLAMGPAMSTVHARLTGGQVVTAAITSEAAGELALTAGVAVKVLIKSTEVGVAIDPFGRISLRNVIPGTIAAVDHGEVMTTTKVEIAGGEVLTAAITKESAEDLGLAVGLAVAALVKSTDVAIAVL
jgi:molybdate transport system regulatory protein